MSQGHPAGMAATMGGGSRRRELGLEAGGRS
jgi:hypothetical protein